MFAETHSSCELSTITHSYFLHLPGLVPTPSVTSDPKLLMNWALYYSSSHNLFICMCVLTCTHICAQIHMQKSVQGRGQKVLDVVLQVLTTLALESGSLTSLEVLIKLSQGSWVSPRDPSLSPQSWDYKYSTTSSFLRGSGTEARSSCLRGRLFID